MTAISISIQEKVWSEFKHLANRRRKTPDALAQQALKEYLERQADEALLERSIQEAKKAKFRLKDTVDVIRAYRQRKAAR